MRVLIILLVMALTVYAPAELTRIIWTGGIYFFPEMYGQYIGETVFIWTFWALIIPVLWYGFKKEAGK